MGQVVRALAGPRLLLGQERRRPLGLLFRSVENSEVT
jgi:hypothetical protein